MDLFTNRLISGPSTLFLNPGMPELSRHKQIRHRSPDTLIHFVLALRVWLDKYTTGLSRGPVIRILYPLINYASKT